MIASYVLVTQGGYALATQTHAGVGLGARLDIVYDLAVHRIYDDRASQCRDGVAHRHRRVYVVILSLEDRMSADQHLHQEIAPGAAPCAGLTLLTYTDALAGIDTRGYGHLDMLAAGDEARAVAVGTLVLDDLACAAAVRAGLDIPDRAEEGLLREHHLPLAAALGAHLRRGAGLGSGAVTCAAGILERELQLLLTAEHSLQEGDADAGADIGALGGAAPGASPSGSPEEVPEDASEDILEVHAAEVEAGSASTASKAACPNWSYCLRLSASDSTA